MSEKNYQWTVIGAGPAGIAAVGKLIDFGVDQQSILWLDPSFTVGDFGTVWKNVSSNTSVRLFQQFYNACKAFDYNKAPNYDIESLAPEQTCYLKQAAEPLAWITNNLMTKVNTCRVNINNVAMVDKQWCLHANNGQEFLSQNIILATGSEPASLPINQAPEITLQVALNKASLKQAIQDKKRIAVFGSSHSAIIIVRDLLELGVEQVDNYYLSPLRYATFFDDWTLFDNTGLKGKTAAWAKENLHGNLPKGLTRYQSTAENIKNNLPKTDAAIFATGFERRSFSIEGLNTKFDYNQHCGIIAPGVFGVGIAFPEKKVDRFGNVEHSVGLWKFMEYINQVMPVWLNYTA